MNQNRLLIATMLITFLLMIRLAFGQQDTTLTVTSSGRVGIGTTNPSGLLSILGGEDITEFIHLTGFDDDHFWLVRTDEAKWWKERFPC